ncbi:hypothetical protein EOM71_02970, partial [Candidatus Falkowbacteria bacterium]|nr:hypothetical protein [Candidatus Falkowbacteria bacterium]
MKNLLKNFFLVLIVFLSISYLFSLYSGRSAKIERIGIESLVQEINNDQIAAIVINGDNLDISLKDNRQQVATKEPGESLSQLLRNFEVAPDKMAAINIKVKNNSTSNLLLTTVLPLALPLILIIGLFYFVMRSAQGANNRAISFGQTTA